MPGTSFLTPTFLTASAGNFLYLTSLAGFFLLPLHLQELGATESQIGLVMGCHTAAAIVLQPLVGVWVDRGRRRPFLLPGAALTALAAVLFALRPDSLPFLALLRLVQGLAYSLYVVALFALVVDGVPPERRGQALGVFGISALASNAAGPVLGEILVRAVGFRGFFLASAVLALLAGATTTGLGEPRGTPLGAGSGTLAGLVAALRVAPHRVMGLTVAFGLGVGVVFTFLPTFARSLGVERVAPFALAYSTAALVVRAAGGRLVDTLGRRAVIIPALAIQAGGAALLAATPELADRLAAPIALLAGAGLLAGAAHGFLYPALTALVVDSAPPAQRGRLLGLFSACMLAGQAAGAMGFGAVAEGLGHGPMFGLLALVLGGAVVLATRLSR